MKFRDTKLFADNIGLLRTGCEGMEMVSLLNLSSNVLIMLTYCSFTSISKRQNELKTIGCSSTFTLQQSVMSYKIPTLQKSLDLNLEIPSLQPVKHIFHIIPLLNLPQLPPIPLPISRKHILLLRSIIHVFIIMKHTHLLPHLRRSTNESFTCFPHKFVECLVFPINCRIDNYPSFNQCRNSL